jgi:hypothetical protein
MELTKNEKIMRMTAFIYAICFIFTGIISFLIFPDMLIGSINWFSNQITQSLPAYPAGENKFWLSMTLSMMAGVSVTSILIFKDIKKNFEMAVPLCAMKFTSAFFGAGFFITGFLADIKEWTALANFIIFITDFPFGLIMLHLYRRVKAERNMVQE